MNGTQAQFGNDCLNNYLKYTLPLPDFARFLDSFPFTNSPPVRMKCFRKITIAAKQRSEHRSGSRLYENFRGVLHKRSNINNILILILINIKGSGR